MATMIRLLLIIPALTTWIIFRCLMQVILVALDLFRQTMVMANNPFPVLFLSCPMPVILTRTVIMYMLAPVKMGQMYLVSIQTINGSHYGQPVLAGKYPKKIFTMLTGCPISNSEALMGILVM